MLTIHGPQGVATTHTGRKIRFGVWMVRLPEDGSLDAWHALIVCRNPGLQDQLCDLEFHKEPGGPAVLSGQAFVWRETPEEDRNRVEATDRLRIHADVIPTEEELWRATIPEEYRFEENGLVLRLLFPDPNNPLHIEWHLGDED
jgi:hypothetical protein